MDDGLVKPVLALFCSCFDQEVGNRVDLDYNARTLTTEMAQLRTTRSQVQGRVDYAEGTLLLVRTREVKIWLESVDDLDAEVGKIHGELQAQRDPSSPGWLDAPRRWWKSYLLSGRVATSLREVRYLQRHGDFKEVAERPTPAPASRAGDATSGSVR